MVPIAIESGHVITSFPVRTGALAATVLLAGGLLTACGSSGASDPADGPSIVASTNVYADIAEQVAADHATVESVISDPTADPHSYEASPADAAAVSTADLVVYNGAGYDAFVDRALANADGVPVVRATDEFERATSTAVAGHSHAHDHGEGGHDHAHDHGHASDPVEPGATTNEHVWFSLPTVSAVAEQIAEELAAIDAEHADEYRANADEFADALDPLTEQIAAIGDRGPFDYAQTEPIGVHLFEAAHLHDLTPHGFLASVEDDTDPSAADLTTTLDLLRDHRVDFLAFNVQTETPVTARVRDAAENAGLVVVDLTETLPDGDDYVTWMTGIVDDLTTALDGAEPAGDAGH